ncbi:hypothetical protein [Rothia sp. P5766]|uniref:hypothetical protein n=1 Tax=Rothia sp. P5766 TaxID=3402656 RepID=UPI003AD9DE1A
MVIRDVILRGAGLDFRLSNHEELGAQVEGWLTDLVGWFGGVGVSDTGAQRKLGHGYFTVPSLRTSREITLSGVLHFLDEWDRSVADRFLSGILWDGEFGELEVSINNLTLVSRVKLAGDIKHAYAGTEALKFQIPLTAPDPFLYAPARTYQIFPAGTGEGLRYPLFAQSGEQLPGMELTRSRSLPATRNENGELYFSFSDYQTGDAATAQVQAGKTYQITVRNRADRPGSKMAIRSHLWGWGNNSIFKYLTQSPNGSVVVESDGEWQTWTRLVPVPDGYTSLLVTLWANHPLGSVTDASQEYTISMREAGSPVLEWGAGAPVTGACANNGNADAHPVYTVSGSWPAGFRIVTGNRVIEYPSPIHPSNPARIDNRTGSVTVGGADQTYRLTRRDWVTVPAGTAIQPRIEALAPSTGWCDVTIQDTYI